MLWHTSEFWHIPHSVFSDICWYIQSYSALLRHTHKYWGIFRLIQAYTAPCVTLVYSQPCHILSPGIFRTGCLFKTLWVADQAYSELWHRASFSQIQTYSELSAALAYAETWHIRILEYSEPFHNCIPTHIQNPAIFTKSYEYSELWHI